MDQSFILGFVVGSVSVLILTLIIYFYLNRNNNLNHKRIDEVLSPLKERLKEYQDSIERINENGIKNSSALKTQLDFVLKATGELEDQTENLTKALKGDVKVQGNWGEFILERLFTISGLKEDRDYTLQAKGMGLKSDSGKRQMPDAIIHLPDESHIIVDSKVSLVSYERYSSSESEVDLKDLFISIKSHIDGLSSKEYSKNADLKTPQFVILFMPIDRVMHLLGAHKSDLMEYSWSKGVMLTSPSNLMPILKTIGSLWQITDQNNNSKLIAQKASLFLDKFTLLYEELFKIEQDFVKLQASFDKSLSRIKTGKGNLIDKAQELKDLGVS